MITADKILSEHQLKKLFNKLKQERDKSLMALSEKPHLSLPSEVRIIMDFYIFSLIANTGLRVSEATKIQVDDVGEDYIKIDKLISKNGKDGTVYFGRATRRIIDEYICFRDKIYGDFNTRNMFPSKSSRSRCISRSYLHIRFKYWLKICNLPGHLSIHSLRHTYGTLCLDKGLGLTFVRDQLRHSSISTTSKYLHLTQENRKKVQDIF